MDADYFFAIVASASILFMFFLWLGRMSRKS
jgi:hypothetical protein